MPRLKELLGSNYQLYENIINEAMFRARCCIPGIVQSYNPNNNTAEVQPAIREKVVEEGGVVSYQALPLLINVPVVFPRVIGCGITFPLKKNDQCLVVFSDLAIDNFWQKGSVQNPVEIRRHDLSDGIAIPCSLSLSQNPNVGNNLTIVYGNTSIVLGNNDITFHGPYGSFTGSQLYNIVNRHTHEYSTGTGTSNTSGPQGV